MTICPKCREVAAKVAEDNNSWPREGEEIANEIRALPTHPQDAEVREGIALTIVRARWPNLSTYEAEWPLFLKAADAILAYLASQGWRRVGEGE